MYNGMYYMNEYTTLFDTEKQKVEFEILLYGKPLGNENLDTIHARYRNIRVPLYQKIMGTLQMNIYALRGKHYIQQGNTVVKSANTDFSTTDIRMLYQQLDKLIQTSSEAWYCHLQASMASNMASAIIQHILDTGRRQGKLTKLTHLLYISVISPLHV
ncbi:PREDICTED: uncharacterized protein LOC106818111 [Priapulus caudatus]|uniref:Uncharacterized protein LOC106818111 n=1 Tax=Priapulus caudatus TaxID=37621 RepID=A0ABM1F1J9_PRICU|nr:PREDICTED: uncharacterized protein LOC106818111 [Priapulus caudatus]